MDSHIRSDSLSDTIAKIIIGAILFGLLVWGLSIGDAGATTFTSPQPGSNLPPRPPIQECKGSHCDDTRAPTATPFVSPLAAPARAVVRIAPPTPIQWRSHAPAWPADFRRARR